ncbi:Inner membrane protein ybjO [Edwardsiella tarda]|nr:Inner membrane protein ybjO [Edwardsiella tarda]
MAQMISIQPRIDSLFAAPVPVLIAGTALIGVRLASVVLLCVALGPSGIATFLGEALHSWQTILLLVASLALWVIELGCGLALMLGKPLSRWIYLGCQLLVVGYMWWASLGWFHPELFRVPGDDGGQILQVLLGQKLPDLLILALLFIPSASRRYFRRSL